MGAVIFSRIAGDEGPRRRERILFAEGPRRFGPGDAICAVHGDAGSIGEPAFEEAPCPFTAGATVAENRAVPDRRRLKLAVAILKSLSASPRPAPNSSIA